MCIPALELEALEVFHGWDMVPVPISPISVCHDGRFGPAELQGACSLTYSCKNGFGDSFAPVPAELHCQSHEIDSSHEHR